MERTGSLRRALIAIAVAAPLSVFAAAPSPPTDPEVFPDATADLGEAAALRSANRTPRVFRTARPFDVVVNYYRFKRKQSVQVTVEPLAAPFSRIARAFESGPSETLIASRLVQQFHRHVFGRPNVDPARAARAWQSHAERLGTGTQFIGEGERVTIYRPYVSRRTFDVIDATVLVLQTSAGSGGQ